MRHGRTRRCRSIALPIIAWLILGQTPLGADNHTPQQAERVKAAFVFKFAKFCEWPEGAKEKDEPFRIGIAASPSMVEALSGALDGKTVNDVPIVMVDSTDAADLSECQIVFLGDDNPDRNKELLAEFRGKPVLTMGDSGSFIENGGMVHLFQQENKLRFDIHLDVAKEANLKISSRVLDLATRVIGSASSIDEDP